MVERRHLRTRVYGIAIVYAATLLATTFLITTRAKQTQARYDALIGLQTETIDRLESIVTHQNTFAQYGRMQAAGGSDLAMLPARYASVRQLLDRLPDNLAEKAQLKDEAQALAREIERAAGEWDAAAPAERERLWSAVEVRSAALRSHLQTIAAEKRGVIEAERPRLERAADNVLWFALGIAWLIAVGSFAFAQLTLRKVVRPIEELARAAAVIATNDFSVRAPVAGDREIANLGIAFNGMAASLARYDQELKARARTDELTGLPNFRAFREHIDAEIERASRYEHSFGILVLDLDHFKKYNDTYGHQAGNEVLEAVARAVRSTLRKVDIPARYGGEEFAVILPQVDAAGMARLAERIRAAVERIPPIGKRSRVTVSIGGSLCPAEGSTAQALFEVADARLYAAKERGRNCTVTPANALRNERSA